jgi:hypothetical protein
MTPLALMGPRSQRRHDTTLPWLSGTGLGDLPTLGNCSAGSPDFAVDNNREATLDRGRSAKPERSHTDAALRDQIFEDFARPAKVERCLCLVLGDAN